MTEKFITEYLEAFKDANPQIEADKQPTIEKASPGWYKLHYGYPTTYRKKDIQAMTERLKIRKEEGY